MALIWCSISGHGFGHAAQVVPTLNALGRLVPNLMAVLRTTVPPWFFQNRLTIPWEISRHVQDIGCVQQGPLHIDVEATWIAYADFHRIWDTRVKDEVSAIESRSPDLVLSDVSYLALEAGARASVPAVGLSSLSWDVVLERLETNLRDEHVPIIRQIRHSYRYADLMIRVAPALPMPAFRHSLNIAPIAAPAASEADALRRATNASSDERIVAVAFGGIPLTSLPWARIEQMHGYRFIIPGDVPQSSRRIISAENIPMSFPSIMASSDLLLTKPGYGTIVDAVATRRRVVYVRRYNFADEDVLIDYLHRYGCGIELSAGDFLDGRWEDTMDAVLRLSAAQTSAPLAGGAEDAAHLLKTYL